MKKTQLKVIPSLLIIGLLTCSISVMASLNNGKNQFQPSAKETGIATPVTIPEYYLLLHKNVTTGRYHYPDYK